MILPYWRRSANRPSLSERIRCDVDRFQPGLLMARVPVLIDEREKRSPSSRACWGIRIITERLGKTARRFASSRGAYLRERAVVFESATGSTWNYMSVHALGKIRFLGEPELLKVLEQTTAQFENDKIRPLSSVICRRHMWIR